MAQGIGGLSLKKVDVPIHVTNAIDGEAVMEGCQGVICWLHGKWHQAVVLCRLNILATTLDLRATDAKVVFSALMYSARLQRM